MSQISTAAGSKPPELPRQVENKCLYVLALELQRFFQLLNRMLSKLCQPDVADAVVLVQHISPASVSSARVTENRLDRDNGAFDVDVNRIFGVQVLDAQRYNFTFLASHQIDRVFHRQIRRQRSVDAENRVAFANAGFPPPVDRQTGRPP